MNWRSLIEGSVCTCKCVRAHVHACIHVHLWDVTQSPKVLLEINMGYNTDYRLKYSSKTFRLYSVMYLCVHYVGICWFVIVLCGCWDNGYQ